MTPRLRGPSSLAFAGPAQWYPRTVPSSAFRASHRHVSSSTSSSSSSSTSSSKRGTFVRIAVVTATAGSIGAYIRWQQDSKNSTLNPFTFTHYELVSREPISSTSSLFTLRPVKPGHNREVYEAAWRTGVWSVMFKQPQLQIGRDYTPLPPIEKVSDTAENILEGEDQEPLRFLIRRDPHGEVSRYLHGLSLGSTVEMRGPQVECEIPSDVKDILFIAGGTGIAPALQAAYTLLRRDNGTAGSRIHILWANRKREDCLGGSNDSLQSPAERPWWRKLLSSSPATAAPEDPSKGLIVKELETLKSQFPGQITVDYFVDEERTMIDKQSILRFTKSSDASTGRGKLILVSGPDGFISYMAGPKMWAEGRELQGPLQGIIRELDLKGWNVWKL
ncbi:mitochondrial peripheral inner membrane protein [Paecilomyces lecythidis]|uniref:Mitochondrial peripheral inner membrane protein n=1 Tax=Paecilomyces lecythidis TaxID=3004212 RepID=A0ABR3XBA4_9EURO